MQKTVYIYDNDRQRDGVYVSEHFVKSYDGGDCEEIVVEIPDELEPYEMETGTAVRLGEYRYTLDECMRIGRDDTVYLKQMEPAGRAIPLEIVSRNGRRSIAFTLPNE